ncbi:MAG: hypothetical protein EXS55_00105 [Candidatus Magasanikbacteria bacterium]|nr:hypothetical protein [Candidatus Magasanikbacteria bacterium]
MRTVKIIVSATLVISVIMAGVGWPYSGAEAAALMGLSDTMSSLKVNTASSHILTFTSPTGANENTDTIIVTFPSDFNLSSKAINTVTFTHGANTGAENTETLAANPSATAWGAVFSGVQNRILTLTAPTDGVGAAAVAASDKLIMILDSSNAVNPSVAGPYTITISGTFGDAGIMSVQIVTNDQVAISATVAPSLSFSISANTIDFGTLSSAAARYAGVGAGSDVEAEAHTLIASTNGNSGYTVTVKGATLTSGANTVSAIGNVNTASSAGTEQFGLRSNAAGGSGAVSAPYAAAGFAYAATGNTASTVASAAGASANTTYSVRYLANIGANTEAGSYTATLTYVATANF